MLSIKKLLIAASFAALAAAQASQIGDGQPQIPTTAPAATEIGDGQPQVPTTAPAVSQITDGQIQGPTAISSGAPVPSANGTGVVAPSPSPFVGAGNALAWSKGMGGAAIVVVAGLAMM